MEIWDKVFFFLKKKINVVYLNIGNFFFFYYKLICKCNITIAKTNK